ncbi:MAG: hypothetical protein ACPGVO_10550 [Spirulinaceae cyanobacterium]
MLPQDFGIIIACCDQDYLFAKGCCASIRHFLGDVPIALIIDGTFSVEPLQRLYGVQVLNHDTVQDPFLRQHSFGWGKTKMIAFWESPWQHFLVLDADTNVWGNILRYANFEQYDVIIDDPQCSYPEADIEEYFFDIATIETHFPDFNWRAHREDYFCTGTFFASRGIFPLTDYQEILAFTAAHPQSFKYGEMGFLNFMFCRAADAGQIRLNKVDFQLLAPDQPLDDLQTRFPVTAQGPQPQGDDATVIHWCGPKPWLMNQKAHPDPMTFARREFLARDRGYRGWRADLWLQAEDNYSLLLKYQKKARKKIRRLLPF